MLSLSRTLQYYSYFFLFLTVIQLWLPKNDNAPIWIYTLVVSVTCGLISHLLEPIAFIPIILLALACYKWQHKKTNIYARFFVGLTIFLLCVTFDIHHLPGFHNLEVFHQVHFTKDAIPYTMYLNFDKALTGIFLLGFSTQLIRRKRDWLILSKQFAIIAPVVIFIVIITALLMGFVGFSVKLPSNSIIWMLDNLFFVCVAEEAFFRGFIQQNLSTLFSKVKFGNYLAILGASILFGLAHFPGGMKYVILATIAGMGYGWIYYKTKRIEGSILTHFSLNLIHFLMFTYPALASP